MITKEKDTDAKKVLIDTWWNVNADKSPFAIASVTSFNRYMVECECASENLCEDF